jgi:hypothetical protein
MRFGNMEIGKEMIANFEGVGSGKPSSEVAQPKSKIGRNEDALPIAPIAEYLRLKQKLQKRLSFSEQKSLQEELSKMETVSFYPVLTIIAHFNFRNAPRSTPKSTQSLAPLLTKRNLPRSRKNCKTYQYRSNSLTATMTP